MRYIIIAILCLSLPAMALESIAFKDKSDFEREDTVQPKKMKTEKPCPKSMWFLNVPTLFN